jgi:Xaa-Pro aminopeptidase
MKTDIDSLMQAHDLDALLVTGAAQHNPDMVYFTGIVHVTHADLIKKRGEAPVLFHGSMERDEAAKSSLRTKDLGAYNYRDLLLQAGGDHACARALRYQKVLTELGISSGRLAVSGMTDLGPAFGVFSELQKQMPGLTVTGEDDSVLLQARATKDEAEIEQMRQIGRITTNVVGMTADFLTSHKAKDGVLTQVDGQPLTIGDVKKQIDLWLAEAGAENPEGTIFAIGRDAGVPHSSGTASDVLRLGQTIVFDIFPCQAGGGYFHDITRTWCLGYATDEVLALYNDVLAVYRQMIAGLKPNTPCPKYQERACEMFEAQGHPTVKTDPQTERGYVHSLGHGLGLAVHEAPWAGLNAGEKDILAPGVVWTVEPGLYYPERGMGVRLESSVWMRPDGQPEILGEYPLDLVLPVQSI